MDKELNLAVTCYGKVKPLKYDLVLLPWGLPNRIICTCLI